MAEQNDLLDVLGARNIAQPGNGGLSGDPLTGTILRIPVGEIDLYHLNPRKSRNARHDEIKENIRRLGQLQPFGVTRPPDSQRWMVAGGGNTRLTILDELRAETGDVERFGYATVYVVPWDSHVERLLAHWIENEQRSGVTFIDRALSRREARGLIEEERRAEALEQVREPPTPMSLAEFADTLTERLGYRVHKPHLSVMDYAVDRLLPALPRALEAGMGRDAVQALRKLDNAAGAAWNALAQDREDLQDQAYDALWAEALATCDDDSLDMDWLREELEERLARLLERSISDVRLEIHYALNGRKGEKENPKPEEPAEPVPLTESPTAPTQAGATPDPAEPLQPEPAPPTPEPGPEPEPEPEPDLFGHTPAEPLAGLPDGQEAAEETVDEPTVEPRDEIAREPAGQDDAGMIPITEPPPPKAETPLRLPRGLPPRYDGFEDLKTLKSRAFVLAKSLAARAGIQECVVLSMRAGLGWVMEAPPEDKPLTGHERDPGHTRDAQQAARKGRLRQWVWHFLVAASEQFPAFDHQYKYLRFGRLLEVSMLQGDVLRMYQRFHLRQDPPGESDYERRLGFVEVHDLCVELFSNPSLPEPAFQEAMYLIEVCRRIRQVVAEEPGATGDGNELWATDADVVDPQDQGWEGDTPDPDYEIDPEGNQDEGWEE